MSERNRWLATWVVARTRRGPDRRTVGAKAADSLLSKGKAPEMIATDEAVSRSLARAGWENWSPTETRKIRRARGRGPSVRHRRDSLLPGYLLVRAPGGQIHSLLEHPLVDGVLSIGNKPAYLLDEQVQQWRQRLGGWACEEPQEKAGFEIGQRVRVAIGALSGLIGSIDQIQGEYLVLDFGMASGAGAKVPAVMCSGSMEAFKWRTVQEGLTEETP